jgi:hypothetical protein
MASPATAASAAAITPTAQAGMAGTVVPVTQAEWFAFEVVPAEHAWQLALPSWGAMVPGAHV